MSEKPVLFKQRSSKAKISQRTRETSEADGPSTVEESSGVLASKLMTKTKRAKPKTQLSFGGDEEGEGQGEVFQLKKSSLSQKLTLGKNAAPTSTSIGTVAPQRANSGPVYDQAYLNELKASTPTLRHPQSQDAAGTIISVDSVDDMAMDVDNVEAIPSESTIKNAKDKRERLRNQGGQEDFISLTVSRRGKDDGPHPESRLVREEDELGEGDDEFAEYTSAQERIALGKKSRKVEANKQRDTMREMIEDADEQDPEAMEWEAEQLRRGGLREDLAPQAAKPVYKAASIPPAAPLPSLSTSVDRLGQALAALTTSHSSHSSSLLTLAEDRKQLDTRETELRRMVEDAEIKRSWFAAFREWVESLAMFLDEKFPQLEALEEEHLSLLRERAEMISLRRKNDDSDDLSIVYGPLTREEPLEVTDEYGRVIPKPTPASRRADRLARRAKRQAASKSREEEGYSTDSSLPPPDDISYRNALDSLADKRKDILADVRAPEFINPTHDKGIAGWWSNWREKWSDSYIGAWGGLGLVGAWEFWVRLEMLGWDCIESKSSLDTFEWYQGLYEYSRASASEEAELGPDGDLASAMISTTVIPRICKLIENGALDVYSDKAIRRVIDIAEELSSTVEEGNPKLHMLLQVVKSSFASEVTSSSELVKEYITRSRMGPPPGFNPEAIPARMRFLARNLKLMETLLKWRKYTGERLGIGELCTTVAKTCAKVAEGGLQVGGLEVLHRISALVPPELVPYEVNALTQV